MNERQQKINQCVSEKKKYKRRQKFSLMRFPFCLYVTDTLIKVRLRKSIYIYMSISIHIHRTRM